MVFEHHGASCPDDCLLTVSIEELKEIYEEEDNKEFYEALLKLKIGHSVDGPYWSTIYRRE